MKYKDILAKVLPYRLYYLIKRKVKNQFDERNLIYDFLNFKNGVMFDVGSMDGSSFMPFLLKKWEVFAFEPDKKNHQTILNNLKNWKFKINLIQKAVSDVEETKLFYTSKSSTGIPSLLKFNENQVPSHELSTIVLNDFIKERDVKKIDFLKIDAEGYDFMVLKGFDFSKFKPRIIMCEFEDGKTKHLGYSTKDMAQFLIDQGYYLIYSIWYPIKEYGMDHDWKKLSVEFDEIDPQGWGNIICFSNKKDFNEFKQKHNC